MDENAEQVSVELQTVIDDNGEKEYNTVRETGWYYRRPKADVLIYKETTEDGLSITNMVTLNNDKVSVKRTGSINMHQQFREQRLSENVFQHPHGNIHMETLTHSISYRRLHDKQSGRLTVDYTVRLNGQDERKQQLTLTIRHKEDTQ